MSTAVDPFTGQAVKFLTPVNKDVLSEKYFLDNKWDSWDTQSWQDLTATAPAVLVSDNKVFSTGVQVAPIESLPQWYASFAA
jgi:hypothetical protein